MGSNTTPTSSAANRHSTAEDPRVEECCICLFAIAPLQALFVAPCSHTFHFKCCRPLLQHYPGFQCPLCRSYSDLDASVAIETDEVCFSFQVIDIILIFFLRCYKCSKPKKNPSKKKVSMLGYLYWLDTKDMIDAQEQEPNSSSPPSSSWPTWLLLQLLSYIVDVCFLLFLIKNTSQARHNIFSGIDTLVHLQLLLWIDILGTTTQL